LGPSGSGKTELVMNLAKEMNLPIHIFDMGTMLDPIMSMVGTHTIITENEKSVSKFSVSRFSEAIQQPGIILLDELSRANVLANNLLFPCLDSRRQLSMEYSFHNHEPIEVHPDCVFIATANIGGQYTGTHRLDQALLSRFMVVQIAEPPLDQIKEIIKSEFGFNDSVVKTIVRTYAAINKKHAEFEIQINLTIRNLKTICNLMQSGFTMYDAFHVVTNGLCYSTNDLQQHKTIEALLG
jgi:nitric oxide reductase NorQ protein